MILEMEPDFEKYLKIFISTLLSMDKLPAKRNMNSAIRAKDFPEFVRQLFSSLQKDTEQIPAILEVEYK